MIRFEDVSKQFGSAVILKHLSLEIEKGNLVAIIGASGCGKTTLLKMINRLVRPSAGKIYIHGEDIELKNVIDLRRNIGYVIQQTGLFPHMTVKENIEIIPRVQKKPEAEIKENTLALMRMVGLDGNQFLNRYPTELSGGQQQRVGVARAFATNPDIILMDEPFSALDPITRSDLQDELIDLQAKMKKTVVFVTHDMDEAIKIADKICIMDKGCILQYDTPENILKNPINQFVSDFVGKNRIWSSPEFIRVADIMLDHPVTCTPRLSALKCMEKMRSSKVDSLLVIDMESKKLEGVVRAADIQMLEDKAILAGKVMSKNFFKLSPQDSILTALKIFNENRISTAPVLNEAGMLVGIITRSSLMTTLSGQYMETGVAE